MSNNIVVEVDGKSIISNNNLINDSLKVEKKEKEIIGKYMMLNFIQRLANEFVDAEVISYKLILRKNGKKIFLNYPKG